MNGKFLLSTLLTLALTGLQVHADKPPKGFEKIDQEIVISTMEAQMKYDVRSFSVKPNSKIKVLFKNPDSLPGHSDPYRLPVPHR